MLRFTTCCLPEGSPVHLPPVTYTNGQHGMHGAVLVPETPCASFRSPARPDPFPPRCTPDDWRMGTNMVRHACCLQLLALSARVLLQLSYTVPKISVLWMALPKL